MKNLLSNNKVSDEYDEKKRTAKLQPIGKKILKTYRRKRIDNRTMILIKPEKK